ncbi:NF-kappa-B inhibitor-like protein 1 [Strongylocentrotus purpuratus]|uniref:NF-kappa-B inhibitor-like protein 1 n=1 Tax=Strongylocentrotus purpuratus TaxID=7668 RepID=A0A7M7PMY9_STRPU|nr:NF-kappa-B inhibitor-like protein 1 [Strongylocentrotus purpuratus]|eukprot:XP_791777.2 PREDICTED: NF-kappa-B inhibitor-like protein 1 [Strongylocentrotus purpuratus]
MGKSTEEKLLEYIREGEVLKVKSYLKKHALLDLNLIRHRDQLLRTPLHIACAAGHEKIVRLLMRLGASSEIQDSKGDTPLHLALRRVLHGDEYAFSELVIPILEKSNRNVIDVSNDVGFTPRQMMNETNNKWQFVTMTDLEGRLNRRHDESKHEKEPQWKTVDEHLDEKVMWEHDCWEDYAGHDCDSFDAWASRIAQEFRRKHQEEEKKYQPQAPKVQHNIRLQREYVPTPEAKQETQWRKQEIQMQRQKVRRVERERQKTLKQKHSYMKLCDKVFHEMANDLLRFRDIPWPCSTGKVENMIKVLLCDVDVTNKQELRRFIKAQQLIWHPDKFLQRCGQRLVQRDRQQIIGKVTELAQTLNQLYDIGTLPKGLL